MPHPRPRSGGGTGGAHATYSGQNGRRLGLVKTSPLELLVCPACYAPLSLSELATDPNDLDRVRGGVLTCPHGHHFPVRLGVPRLLPAGLGDDERAGVGACHRPVDAATAVAQEGRDTARVCESFSREWAKHELGDRTWWMDVPTYVRALFLEPVKIGVEDLRTKVVLDAGCGHCNHSVALADHVARVVALDLSSGVETGEKFRLQWSGPGRNRVDLIQADLRRPPLRPATFDLIYSIGVLHHTPNTHDSFRRLVPLLRAGGTMSIWLYRYEPVVTPVLRFLRALTTRVPLRVFDKATRLLAGPFIVLTTVLDALRIRAYPRLSRSEAALNLMDIFAAPYAHHHSIEEVTGWFKEEGFSQVWTSNEGRRGFQISGRWPRNG